MAHRTKRWTFIEFLSYFFAQFFVLFPVVQEEYNLIRIMGADGDDAFRGHNYTVLQNSFDGSHTADHHHCFIGNLEKGGWANYYFLFTTVDHILLRNRDDKFSEFPKLHENDEIQKRSSWVVTLMVT